MLILILLGVLLLRGRHRKLGRVLLFCGFFSLYFISTAFVSNLLIAPLERNHPPLQKIVKTDAIVVLTAGIRDLSHIGLGYYPDPSSLDRLLYGYQVYRSLEGVPLVISGGRADPTKPDISIGKTLGSAALAMGMPKRDLVIEDDSVNTYEGALNVRRLLKVKKVILVTSASHMARSVRLYRKAGFDVIPAPTDFMGGPESLNLYSFIPTAGSMAVSSTALYEYLSTGWYLISGTL